MNASQRDTPYEQWFSIYDKVRNAGKSLWIRLYDGDFCQWVDNAERIVKRYGSDGLYFLFPEMSEAQGKELVRIAETRWG